MKVEVYRYDSGPDDTLGKLYINGKFYCYTIEDQYRSVKVKGDTRIPAGVYKLGLVNSPRFSRMYGHDMIWVKNVPGFSNILIHPGNTKTDTEGCLLLGKKVGSLNKKRAVLDSKSAYSEVYPIVSEAIKKGEVTIQYFDNDAVV